MTCFQFVRLLAVSLALFSLALPVAARAETQWFSLKGDPDYADVQAQLLALVNINGFHTDNNFCVVGERDNDGEQAFVYWPTEDKLIDWDRKVDDPEELVDAQNFLDLNRDVVATQDEVGSSTYLVTTDDIKEIIHSCNKFGDHYHVTKSKSGWRSPEDLSQFSTLRTRLQELVTPPQWMLNDTSKSVHPSKQINKFCIVAQKDRSWLAAYVYWETEQRLILWVPTNDNVDALLVSYGDLDLKNGIASSATPHNLIYQMSKRDASHIINACSNNGINVVIYANLKENSNDRNQ